MTKIVSTRVEELVADVVAVDPEALRDSTGPENLSEWDSLAHISIIAAIERTFGVEFQMEEMFEIKSIGDIKARLKSAGVLD
jgi:acyl carrier protein